MNSYFLNNFTNNSFLKILFILLLYFLTKNLIKKTIDRLFLNLRGKIINKSIQAKSKTIATLLKNVFDVILIFIALLIILSQLGINIMPIITGAGVAGLAISFGAQTLVKDLIVGFFILIEDQFNIGDYVKIGSFEGKVVNLTLRMTVLKDKEENLIYIPNSQINSVIKIKKNFKNQN